MLPTLAAVALASAAPGPSAAEMYRQVPGCTVDVAAMLQLSPYDFDQTDKGFRSLSSKPGCDVATANLIATYRRSNWGKLDRNAVQISYWHEGQSRAFAGQTELAIPLLLAGVNPGVAGLSAQFDRDNASIGMANAEYGLATVAFLQGDLAGLKTARARLAAVPRPSMWTTAMRNSAAPGRPSMNWPPNLNIVDELIRCFGKPYKEAYSCDAIAAAKRGHAP